MSNQHEQCRFGVVYYGAVELDGEVIQVGEDHNLIPQVGINYLAGLIRGTGAPISPWYVGVFEGNFVPAMSTTAADLPGNAVECVAYNEASRPVWNNSYDGLQTISSLATRADFTMNAAKRLYGAFIVSTDAKGSPGGVLLSIARFAAPYDLPAGAVFHLGAKLVLVP